MKPLLIEIRPGGNKHIVIFTFTFILKAQFGLESTIPLSIIYLYVQARFQLWRSATLQNNRDSIEIVRVRMNRSEPNTTKHYIDNSDR